MLTRFENDGLELVIDTQTGESFATQRGYARISGKNSSTISRRCEKLDASSGVKMAEIDTGYGVKVVALIPESLISDWIVDDNPALAKQMLKAGVRVFLHTAAGYEIQAIAPQSPVEAPKQLPPMSYETMLEMQKLLFAVADKTGDKRALITLQSSLQNALIPAHIDQETKDCLLSVSEVCELHGVRIPQKKDSPIGRIVAKTWRQSYQTEPQECAKHVGSGHRAAAIKVYPPEFFERIVAIAKEYLLSHPE